VQPVKFVYKINSSYDGFRPTRIPDRLEGKRLELGWKTYIEVVELGDEIWVYFLGRHKFEPGIYARGIAEAIDYESRQLTLRVTKYAVDKPLTDPALTTKLAKLVAIRYRQVFVLPDELDVAPACTVSGTADSCKQRSCASCPNWKRLPIIDRGNLLVPHRLSGYVDRYAPGFWSIPSRSYLFRSSKLIRVGIRRTSELFYRFKTGEGALAFPLALAAHRALAKAQRLDFDAVVPVPLSPDKASAGELNRTLALARELGQLLDAPVRDKWLRLTKPVSKKRLRVQGGLSVAAFEQAYRDALEISPSVSGASLLIVDDVCTEGSTLRVCAEALSAPGRRIVAATAAQMAVHPVVRRPDALWEP
jgi:hypothetical protein